MLIPEMKTIKNTEIEVFIDNKDGHMIYKIMKIKGVSSCLEYGFSKKPKNKVFIRRDFGVVGDVHGGRYVRHLYDIRKKGKGAPNIKQVHLIDSEILQTLNRQGFNVNPGDMGENITTEGVDLMNLPVDTELQLGQSCVIRLTGARIPCDKINEFQSGLMYAVIEKPKLKGDKLKFKSGVMGVVIKSGLVRPNDEIIIRNKREYNSPLPHI